MVLNKHMMVLAASAMFIGGASFAPAKAADLGGDCCADLEERVAELEATTARKGNRKVSLTVSGQVNRALLAWDDGVDSDVYVVSGDFVEDDRVRFSGNAKMKPGWNAGFVIEIGISDSSATSVSQGNDEGPGETVLSTRLANWYIESEQLGRLTVGQGHSASDGITVIHTDNAFSDVVPWYNLSFDIRTKGGGNSGLKWGDIAWGLEGYKGDFIRYDSPSIYGFILSAAWGENDSWDAALRYSKEWNSIRIAAGIGYQWIGDATTISLYPNETEVISGSVSAMHVPTGLFVNFAAGQMQTDAGFNPGQVDVPTDGTMWLVQVGIEKRFMSYGATTIYGEYGNYDDIFTNAFGSGGDLDGNKDTDLSSSEATRWGLGVVQKFDSAALDLYVVYQHWEADIASDLRDPTSTNLEDLDLVISGARIKF